MKPFPYGRLDQAPSGLLSLAAQDNVDRFTVGHSVRVALLALQVAHFQRLYGHLPLDENIDLLESKGLTEAQADRMADGLEVLAMALASVRDDEPDPSLQ